MPVVEIPGTGNVEFPDDMSGAQISAAILKITGGSKLPGGPGSPERMAAVTAKPPEENILNKPGFFGPNHPALNTAADVAKMVPKAVVDTAKGAWNAATAAPGVARDVAAGIVPNVVPGAKPFPQTPTGKAVEPMVKGAWNLIAGSIKSNLGYKPSAEQEAAINQLSSKLAHNFGSMERFSKWAQENPAQLAMILAPFKPLKAIGEVVPGAQKAGEIVSDLASIPGKLTRSVERGTYESALSPPLARKWTKNLTAEDVNMRGRAITRGLEEGRPVSIGGIIDAENDIEATGKKIRGLFKDGKGATRESALQHIEEFKKEWSEMPEAQAEIEEIRQQILKDPLKEGLIPAKRLQDWKEQLYKINRKKYGELGSLKVEANKTVARGLKDAIEELYPETKHLNADQGADLLWLDAAERKVARTGNRELLHLGDAALAAGGKWDLAMARHFLEMPGIKSRFAIMLNRARRLAAKAAAAAGEHPTSVLAVGAGQEMAQ